MLNKSFKKNIIEYEASNSLQGGDIDLDGVLKEYFGILEEQDKNKLSGISDNDDLLNTTFKLVISELFLLATYVGLKAKDDKITYVVTTFLATLGNNLYVVKGLFEKGYHIQLKILLRSQLELISITIALIGDKEFTDLYTKINTSKNSSTTPKPVNTEKTVKKILLTLDIEKGHTKNWLEIQKQLYSQLSETSHGNLGKIFQDSYQKDQGTELYNFSIGGSDDLFRELDELISLMLGFSQISNSIISKLLEMEKFFEHDKASLIWHHINVIRKIYIKL